MEFRSERRTEGCWIFLSGRLDASSADAFIEHVEAEIRVGAELVALDLTEVGFVSSVGLGALIKLVARVRSSGGRLAVVSASDAVADMLRVTRLDKVLPVGPPSPAAVQTSVHATTEPQHGSTPHHAATPHHGAAPQDGTTSHRSAAPQRGATLATVPLGRSARLVGEARLLSPEPSARLVPMGRACGRAVEAARVSADLVAIGHGALARDEHDAGGRFGEALVVGGVAVVTAAATGHSDFVSIPVEDDPARTGHGAESPMSASPPVWMLDGIACRGVPRWGTWFEAADGDVALHEIIGAVASLEDGPCAVIVAGECAGLVGASARTSPDSWTGPLSSQPPKAIKSMVRLSVDPVHAGDTAVIVAFVGAAGGGGIPQGRPLDAADPRSPSVHAHAVAMSFRPVSRHAHSAAQVVGSLLAEQRLRTVMHLVQPARSAMRRGAAWRISLETLEEAR